MGSGMLTIRKELSSGLIPRAEPVANAYFSVTFSMETPRGMLSDDELLQAALDSGAFDFWRDAGEDVYSLEDGEPV
jgi:hypothetical protein